MTVLGRFPSAITFKWTSIKSSLMMMLDERSVYIFTKGDSSSEDHEYPQQTSAMYLLRLHPKASGSKYV